VDSRDRDQLFENDREWRAYLVEKIEALVTDHADTRHRITKLEVWGTVYRVAVSALFGLLLVYVEYRLK
jgi:hypothetical protein